MTVAASVVGLVCGVLALAGTTYRLGYQRGIVDAMKVKRDA